MTLRSLLAGLLTLSLLGTFTAAPSQANLITNGGFEEGENGWTITPADSGSLFYVDGNPHAGASAAWFGAVFPPDADSISQTLATIPGQAYEIDFWLANDGGPENRFDVTWGGISILSLVDVDPFGYTEFRFTEVASATSTVLQFSSYQTASYFNLDDVQVNVPEPGSLLLLGSGLAGLGALRRRKAESSRRLRPTGRPR